MNVCVQRHVYVSTFECTSMCAWCECTCVCGGLCKHGLVLVCVSVSTVWTQVKVCTEAYACVCECAGVVKCVSMWVGVWLCKHVSVQACLSVSTV